MRCAACGHAWRATQPAEPIRAVPEPAAGEPLVPPAPVDEEPAARPMLRRPARGLGIAFMQRRARAAAWGGAGAAVLVLVALTLGFRAEIVAAWPRAASAYALFGFEANARGLAFADIVAERSFEDGTPVLAVSATVRNLTGRARPVPPVRIGLRDAKGREVSDWVVALETTALEKGAATRFTARIARPPEAAQDLELRFVDAAKTAEPKPAAARAAMPGGAHGPAPGKAEVATQEH